jgi:hypothetical protein
MRRTLFALLLLASFTAFAADEITGHVIKVLPFLVDKEGRIAKSPSLFDRDAYQAYLLIHSNEVTALRYDVQWKAAKVPSENLKLRLELRGVTDNGTPRSQVLETNFPAGTFHQWTSLMLSGTDYKNFGSVVAWHATLWNGDQQLDEQKSFLW